MATTTASAAMSPSNNNNNNNNQRTNHISNSNVMIRQQQFLSSSSTHVPIQNLTAASPPPSYNTLLNTLPSTSKDQLVPVNGNSGSIYNSISSFDRMMNESKYLKMTAQQQQELLQHEQEQRQRRRNQQQRSQQQQQQQQQSDHDIEPTNQPQHYHDNDDNEEQKNRNDRGEGLIRSKVIVRTSDDYHNNVSLNVGDGGSRNTIRRPTTKESTIGNSSNSSSSRVDRTRKIVNRSKSADDTMLMTVSEHNTNTTTNNHRRNPSIRSKRNPILSSQQQQGLDMKTAADRNNSILRLPNKKVDNDNILSIQQQLLQLQQQQGVLPNDNRKNQQQEVEQDQGQQVLRRRPIRTKSLSFEFDDDDGQVPIPTTITRRRLISTSPSSREQQQQPQQQQLSLSPVNILYQRRGASRPLLRTRTTSYDSHDSNDTIELIRRDQSFGSYDSYDDDDNQNKFHVITTSTISQSPKSEMIRNHSSHNLNNSSARRRGTRRSHSTDGTNMRTPRKSRSPLQNGNNHNNKSFTSPALARALSPSSYYSITPSSGKGNSPTEQGNSGFRIPRRKRSSPRNKASTISSISYIIWLSIIISHRYMMGGKKSNQVRNFLKIISIVFFISFSFAYITTLYSNYNKATIILSSNHHLQPHIIGSSNKNTDYNTKSIFDLISKAKQEYQQEPQQLLLLQEKVKQYQLQQQQNQKNKLKKTPQQIMTEANNMMKSSINDEMNQNNINNHTTKMNQNEVSSNNHIVKQQSSSFLWLRMPAIMQFGNNNNINDNDINETNIQQQNYKQQRLRKSQKHYNESHHSNGDNPMIDTYDNNDNNNTNLLGLRLRGSIKGGRQKVNRGSTQRRNHFRIEVPARIDHDNINDNNNLVRLRGKINSNNKSLTAIEGNTTTNNIITFQQFSENAPSCDYIPPNDISFTLVTQLSLNRLWMIERHCTRWAMSSWYYHDDDDDDDSNKNKTRTFHPISMAVYVGHNTSATIEWIYDELKHMKCPVDVITVEILKGYSDEEYPVNVLRNIALSNVKTSHVVYVDVDFWPSIDLYDTLYKQREYLSNNIHTALVIPAFQLNRQCKDYQDCPEKNIPKMPYNKNELIQLIIHHKATPFDPKNAGGHGSTRYKDWLEQPMNELIPIECVNSNRYEPYTVFRYCHDIPPFQEVFTGYGKNKMTWMMQLLYSGYNIYQISTSYVIHYPHLDSNARLKWNGGLNGEQINKPKQIRNIESSESSDANIDAALSLSSKYKRAQIDETFVQFRNWLINTYDDVSNHNNKNITRHRQVFKCTDAMNDDDKLWVDNRTRKKQRRLLHNNNNDKDHFNNDKDQMYQVTTTTTERNNIEYDEDQYENHDEE